MEEELSLFDSLRDSLEGIKGDLDTTVLDAAKAEAYLKMCGIDVDVNNVDSLYELINTGVVCRDNLNILQIESAQGGNVGKKEGKKDLAFLNIRSKLRGCHKQIESFQKSIKQLNVITDRFFDKIFLLEATYMLYEDHLAKYASFHQFQSSRMDALKATYPLYIREIDKNEDEHAFTEVKQELKLQEGEKLREMKRKRKFLLEANKELSNELEKIKKEIDHSKIMNTQKESKNINSLYSLTKNDEGRGQKDYASLDNEFLNPKTSILDDNRIEKVNNITNQKIDGKSSPHIQKLVNKLQKGRLEEIVKEIDNGISPQKRRPKVPTRNTSHSRLQNTSTNMTSSHAAEQRAFMNRTLYERENKVLKEEIAKMRVLINLALKNTPRLGFALGLFLQCEEERDEYMKNRLLPQIPEKYPPSNNLAEKKPKYFAKTIRKRTYVSDVKYSIVPIDPGVLPNQINILDPVPLPSLETNKSFDNEYMDSIIYKGRTKTSISKNIPNTSNFTDPEVSPLPTNKYCRESAGVLKPNPLKPESRSTSPRLKGHQVKLFHRFIQLLRDLSPPVDTDSCSTKTMYCLDNNEDEVLFHGSEEDVM